MHFSKNGLKFEEITWSHVHVVIRFEDGYDQTVTVSDYFQDYHLNDETVQEFLKWALSYGRDEDYPYKDSFDYIYYVPKRYDGQPWEIYSCDVTYISPENGCYNITLED